jgi:hypothetical protein
MTGITVAKGLGMVLLGLVFLGYANQEWKDGAAGVQHDKWGMDPVTNYSKDDHPFTFYVLVYGKAIFGVILIIGGFLFATGLID